jgi:hypothetical protein
MKRLYLIRREDVFEAIAKGFIKDGDLLECGSIWGIVGFTDEEKKNYPFPIENGWSN